jgi:hypothetical protein
MEVKSKFRYWTNKKSKNKRNQLCDSGKLSKNIKNSVNSSRMGHHLLRKKDAIIVNDITINLFY